VGLFFLLSLAAELLCRLGQRPHSVYYAVGGAGVALISLFGITFPMRGFGGLEDPAMAVALYGVYGVGGLAFNLRWRRPLVSSASLALLIGATLWGLLWVYPIRYPFSGAGFAA